MITSPIRIDISLLTKEAKMEEEYFIVDFESVTIDRETYDKLENDPQYAIDWIINNAKIDQIIRGDEK
tara:strand:+ start:223 stop:426 length:204 start_codon:yes stop_codon:yes gene_type:complete